MKAIVTFNCRLEFDLNEPLGDMIPQDEQIKNMELALKDELGCSRAEVFGYQVMLAPTT